MKESIEIHNVGPVKHFSLADITPMMVFIGRSATGKSTIMKIIALFRYIYKLANIRSFYHLSHIKRSPFRIDFRKLIKENGLEGMFDSSTRILYTVCGETPERSYNLVYEGRKLHALPDVQIEDLVFLKGAFISENRNAISSWLENGLEKRGVNLGYYFTETLNLFLQAVREVKELPLPFMEVKFLASKAKNGQWQYSLQPENRDDRPFKLREASSGMKSTIPEAMIVKYLSSKFDFKDAYRRSVIDYLVRANRLLDFRPVAELETFRPMVSVHIEEPELSLDPASQVMMQEFVVNQLFHNSNSDRTCKLMYATHSPYLTNHLNLLMAQWETDNTQGINPAHLNVYLTTEEGQPINAMVFDEKGRKVVDSDFLASEIEQIYGQYAGLRK